MESRNRPEGIAGTRDTQNETQDSQTQDNKTSDSEAQDGEEEDREAKDVNHCLNCGAAIAGAFCGACGQRSVPADPTVAEIAGDAWQELSGYDGRIAETFRNLLRPGRLTIDYVQGRRARYLSPIRLYLIVSVIYFVVSAAVPPTQRRPGEITGPGGMRIGVIGSAGDRGDLTDADRAALLEDVDSAQRLIPPMLRALAEDPDGFRARLFTIMPRVFFGMLPVFAAIVALFYRRRRFPTALVFAAHLHAFAFVIFTIAEAAKLARMPLVAAVFGVVAAVVFAIYALTALRTVFGGRWPITIAKASGISFVYLCASIPAFFIILVWASLV